jgi:hypothetical protein
LAIDASVVDFRYIISNPRGREKRVKRRNIPAGGFAVRPVVKLFLFSFG